MTEILDFEEEEGTPLLEELGLTGADVKVLTMVQRLAIVDAYASQVEAQAKFVKKVGTLLTSALIEHDDFLDVSNTKLRIPQELIDETLKKLNDHMASLKIKDGMEINYPVTAYRKESWFANILVDNVEGAMQNMDTAIAQANSPYASDEERNLGVVAKEWRSMVKESINATTLRSKVTAIATRLMAEKKDVLLTPEIVKENIPAFIRDYVNVARAFDVVTKKASGK